MLNQFIRSLIFVVGVVFVAVSCRSSMSTASSAVVDDESIQEFDGHQGAVMDAQFVPGAPRFVSVSTDLKARLCHSETGAVIRVFDQHTAPILSSAVSGNGTVLVTGGQDNTVRVWSLPPAAPEVSVESGQSAMSSMTVINEARMLVATGNSRSVDAWSIAAGTGAAANATLKGTALEKSHSWVIPALHSSFADSPFVNSTTRSDGLFVAVASEQGEIVTLSPELMEPIGLMQGHVGRISWMQPISSGQQLLTTGDDGMLRVWQWNPVLPATLVSPGDPLADAVQIPQQNSLLTVQPGGRIQVIAMDSGLVQQELQIALAADSGIQLQRATISSDGQMLAVACSDGSVKIVQRSDGQIPGELRISGTEVRSLQFHPDRQRLAVATSDGAVRFWNLPIPEIRLTGFDGHVLAMDSAANDQWVATLHDDRIARMWNLNGQLVRQLNGHEHTLTCLGIRPDATAIATGDDGGIVRIWGAADGSQLGAVRCSASVVALKFSADQKQLVTASRDGTVAGWSLPLPANLPNDGEPPMVPAWQSQPAAGVLRRLEVFPGDERIIGISESSGLPLGWNADGTDDPLAAKIPGSRLLTVRSPIAGDTTGSVRIAVERSGIIHRQENSDWQSSFVKLTTPLRSAELSPDGTVLAVLDESTRVSFCDVRTGRVLEEIDTGMRPESVAWLNKQGSHLAVAGVGGLKIVRRSLSRSWEGSTAGVTEVLFHADQQALFVAGENGSLRQLRLADGEEIYRGQHHTGAIRAITSTNSGQMIWTAGADRRLVLSNPGQADPVRVIETPIEFTSIVALNDASQIAGAGNDGLVRLYSGTSGHLHETLTAGAADDQRVLSLASADNGQTYVSVTERGEIRRFRVSCQRTWPVHSGAIISASSMNGGGQVLSAGQDRRVLLTETASGKLIREFICNAGEEFQPIVVAARPDNQRIAVGGSNGEVLIFDANKSEEPLQRLSISAEVTALGWANDNQRLAIAGFNNQLHIYGPSVQTQGPKPELVLHVTAELRAPALRVMFTEDNSHVWISLADGRIEQWRYSSPVQLRQFNHGGAVYSVAVNKAGTLAVSGSTDQTVRIWDLATGQQRSQMNGHQGSVHCVRFNVDESIIVSAGADGTLRVWDAVGGRPLRQLTRFSETMYSLAVHPTLPIIAAAGADRLIHLIDLNTGAEIRQLSGHKDYIHSVAFSPDGSRLASYGYAGTLKLWKSESGEEFLDSRIGRVGNGVEFSADGRKLILAGGDGKVRIYGIPH